MNRQRITTVAFTGHRPSKLRGGYDPNHPDRVDLRARMEDAVRRIAARTGLQPVIISGMALGVDQDAARIAIKNNWTLWAYIPGTPDQQCSRWPKESVDRYYGLLEHVDRMVYIKPNDDHSHYNHSVCSGRCLLLLQRRNEAMVDDADHLVAVYDGTPGGTHNCIAYARSLDRDIELIHPNADVEEQAISEAVYAAEAHGECQGDEPDLDPETHPTTQGQLVVCTHDPKLLKIDSSHANFGRGKIHFEYPALLTPGECADVQAEDGRYHPAGYGPVHDVVQSGGITRWKSFSNCD